MTHDHDEDVRVERRAVLQGSLAAAATLALGVSTRASVRADDTFAPFAKRWAELFRELVTAEDSDADRFLYRLCGLIREVAPKDLPRLETPTYRGKGLESGSPWSRKRLMLVELRLAPGAVIRAHNHVGYDFVSMGLEGTCVARHYEQIDKVAPASKGKSKTFRVRETRSVLLRPGRMTHLSRTRDNVHWFRAGDKGATVLDFGMKHGDPGGGYRAFSALEIGDEPVDRKRRIFEAQWIGNPFRK